MDAIPPLLPFTERKVLSSSKSVLFYQLENGIVIHYSFKGPHRLFFMIDEKEVDIIQPMPKARISYYGSRGNVFYFRALPDVKIYQAAITPPETVHVSFFRDQLGPNTMCSHRKEMFWKNHNGNTYAWRIFDDPERDGILVDKSTEFVNLALEQIHRGKAVLRATNPNITSVSAREIKRDAILIEIPQCADFLTYFTTHVPRDSSPFIYCQYHSDIYTLDTETMRFLPILSVGHSMDNWHIVGINHGKITIHGDQFANSVLVIAQLPKSHFDKADDFLIMRLTTDGSEEASSPAIEVELSSRFTREFEIITIIGVGAYGVVFQAANKLDNWSYAVKRIDVESSKESVRKALREVQAMALLDHSGIVRYHSTWIEEPPKRLKLNPDKEVQNQWPAARVPYNDRPTTYLYIQMQLCDSSLAEWLARSGQDSRDHERMRSWFKQIVAAVAFLHKNGLIHRDLKPSNILLSDKDCLKLCDLGIVTQLKVEDGTEVANTNTNVGTALYIAPEQWSLKYDSKVDVFTLGLILAELCIPMSEDDRKEIFTRIRYGLQLQHLETTQETIELISWLTNAESAMRPKCKEILEHQFLCST